MTHFINLRFFASIREQLNMTSHSLELVEPRSVRLIRNELAARGGPWERALGSHQRVLAALNQEVVDEQALVQPGDELAFFPPVTGG
jgi:molybdopterin synthase sulfur carrier subunit